jgi:hypothetical protein
VQSSSCDQSHLCSLTSPSSSFDIQLSRVPTEDLGPVIDRLWDIIPQCTDGAATLLEQIASQEQCIHSFVARGAKKEKVPL